MRRLVLLFSISLLCCSCEKIDLTNNSEDSNVPEALPYPEKTGCGIKSCPYTVNDILCMEPYSEGEDCWVIGYVVGATYRSMSNAEFSPFTTYNTNILLSDNLLCTDVDECIPVELKTAKQKEAYSIPANQLHIGRYLLINATLSTYFHVKGLRDIHTGLWIDDSGTTTSPDKE